MRMPVMSGAVLVHELRRVDVGLPVIVATAYSGDDDLMVARREGLLSVVSKPIHIERVMALLEAARRDGLVALVEDDEAMLDNLSEALRERGFTALTAASVLETDRLGPIRPFAALVDLRVPGGADGEAVRCLERKFPGIPIVVVTAHDESAAGIRVVRIFHKPFETNALMAEVERLYAARGKAR
jgi:DNA-binding response OmpR family regulator